MEAWHIFNQLLLQQIEVAVVLRYSSKTEKQERNKNLSCPTACTVLGSGSSATAPAGLGWAGACGARGSRDMLQGSGVLAACLPQKHRIQVPPLPPHPPPPLPPPYPPPQASGSREASRRAAHPGCCALSTPSTRQSTSTPAMTRPPPAVSDSTLCASPLYAFSLCTCYDHIPPPAVRASALCALLFVGCWPPSVCFSPILLLWARAEAQQGRAPLNARSPKNVRAWPREYAASVLQPWGPRGVCRSLCRLALAACPPARPAARPAEGEHLPLPPCSPRPGMCGSALGVQPTVIISDNERE